MGKYKGHRREDVLNALRENERASIRELCEMTGMVSSNVWYHLHELEREGKIINNHGKARSIRIVDVVKRMKQEASQKMSIARRKVALKSQMERAQKSKSRLSEAERIELVAAKAQDDSSRAFCEDADVKVLASGVKVIVSKHVNTWTNLR